LRSKARGIGLTAAGQVFLDYARLKIVIQGLLGRARSVYRVLVSVLVAL
jgi:hypothetical protein